MYRPIEILLADDHEIFRDGFSLMFNKIVEINLVGEAANGRELVRLAQSLTPDVIVTDIQMPVMNGIEASIALTRELPHIPIIALSMHNEINDVVEILEAGAKGYLIKNAHKTEIIAAIKAVYAGENYYCQQTTQKMAKLIAHSNFSPVQPSSKPEFTETEIAIMRLICQQFANKEIADILKLSKRTIEWHRDVISKKIHVKNTAGIVVYALKNKIYDDGV